MIGCAVEQSKVICQRAREYLSLMRMLAASFDTRLIGGVRTQKAS